VSLQDRVPLPPLEAAIQAAVLAPVPPSARFVFARVADGSSLGAVVELLADMPIPDHLLVGLGASLLRRLDVDIPGVRAFPQLSMNGSVLPTTPAELVFRISGADPGEVLHRERRLRLKLSHVAEDTDTVDGFIHDGGRDLTGYVDGTENPTDEDAVRAGIMTHHGPGLDGGSVLAIQRWVHDFDAFDRLDAAAQDHAIGRTRDTDEELDDAPASAHVKRTAQEDFDPEAFLVRRSMPWRDHRGAGLVFVAFAHSLDPFEAQLRRMVGEDDGVTDAIFAFTTPATGTVAWCPPTTDGHLDLQAVMRGNSR